MRNDPTTADADFTLRRECSSMDAFVAERLRATVEMSLGWADRMLDVLLHLDDELRGFDATEQDVQRLRNGVRDVMMSMQHQDVIGQAIERAAAALEKRAAALDKVLERPDAAHLHAEKVAEIHRLYRAEDGLHWAADADETGRDHEHQAAA